MFSEHPDLLLHASMFYLIGACYISALEIIVNFKRITWPEIVLTFLFWPPVVLFRFRRAIIGVMTLISDKLLRRRRIRILREILKKSKFHK